MKPHLLDAAKEIFTGTNVQITADGHKYLDGYIGSDEGKRMYVKSLVDGWCSRLHTLSEIAKHEPQAAYTAFVAGFPHRFTYSTTSEQSPTSNTSSRRLTISSTLSSFLPSQTVVNYAVTIGNF